MWTLCVGAGARAAGYSLLLLALLLGGCARRYRVEGLVLQVDAGRRSLVVSHRAVPNYMPAMVMPFQADAREGLERVTPGARITFDLLVQGKRSRARNIRVLDARNEGVEGFRFPTPAERLGVGEVVPDFSMVNQQGKTVRLSDFRNRVVAVNFLYTRCPLPEVCPRLAATFLSLQRRFAGRDLTLLSITLDPTYDTPDVLSAYARSIGARWNLLTGAVPEITAAARRFGLIHWAEEGVLVHTSATAIIDRQGRLAALVEGSSYRLEQLADLITQSLGN
jgi:protein SCO1/2